MKMFTVLFFTLFFSITVSARSIEDKMKLIGGGNTGMDFKSSVYAVADAVEDMYDGVKEKYNNWQYKGIRSDAEEACLKIKEGKTVQDANKIAGKLKVIKKEIECLSSRPATDVESCAYYDQKIACLTEIPNAISDGSRSAKPVTPSSSLERVPAASAKSK